MPKNQFLVRRLPPLFAAAMRELLRREGYVRHDSEIPRSGEIARYTNRVYSSTMIESNDYVLEENVVFIFLHPKRHPQLAAAITRTFPEKMNA